MEIDDSFMKNMYDSYIKAENDLVSNVLQQLLKRDPTIDDFKKCSVVRKVGEPDKYALVYQGTNLGIVEREFNTDTISLIFNPIKHA